MSANQLIGKALQYSFKRCSVPVSVTQNRFYSAKSVVPVEEIDDLIKSKKETDMSKTITVHGPVTIAAISGIPEEHVKERLVRIYCTSKNAMQSGTENADRWEIEFDTRSRWENSLMGWSSTGDPQSNVKVQFFDKESAINFVEKNGWQYFIESEKPTKPKVKSYGFNFSWNKRSRVSTK